MSSGAYIALRGGLRTKEDESATLYKVRETSLCLANTGRPATEVRAHELMAHMTLTEVNIANI